MKLIITTFFTLLLISLAGASFSLITQIEREAFRGAGFSKAVARIDGD